ncbi:ATP-binding protein [Streptomyces sp. MST-110588]|uniref:ATP-binding protein n=1 Tax=Streptomyces sp. MST-110588 TaxID=2833628 RepID=UPI001F5C17C9|nr:ATP-binding protein [Streptomyces sp. MST-110588]UNO41902.1 ATP-binding protein [Streptomyces sp. MST-110588]
MLYRDALDHLTRWLEEPSDPGRVLPVTGAVGVGKTRLLRDVRRYRPEAVYVDCRGLDADAVATALLTEWGYDGKFRRMRENPLSDAIGQQARQGAELLVLLGNVHWAGASVTSTEPERIATVLVPALAMYGRQSIRVVVEGDVGRERVRVPLRHENELLLEAPRESESAADMLVDEHQQLSVLALAEKRSISPAAWAALCDAVGVPARDEELVALAAGFPDLIRIRRDEQGIERVGFRRDGLRDLVRARRPAAPDSQARITEFLWERTVGRYPQEQWRDRGAVEEYAAFALPLHAAQAGRFGDLMNSASFVANVDRNSLLTGLALAYPDGVPHGSRASAIHYMEADGIEPSGHDEWVSWLHWSELNRGEVDFAEQLLRCGGPVPWKTVWSRWRPYGIFGPAPSDAACADELVVGSVAGTPVVASRVEIDEDELPDENPDGTEIDRDADGWFAERTWRLHDGAALGASTIVWEYCDLRGHVESVEGRTFEAVADIPGQDGIPIPRHPQSVNWATDAGPDLCVYGGEGGLFAVRITEPNRVVEALEWRRKPLLRTHCRSALWPLPEATSRAGAPTKEWLEGAFGSGMCATLASSQIPEGITHSEARRFLTDIGVPTLGSLLPFAYVQDVNRPGNAGRLPELPGSSLHTDRLPADGRFHRLGRWVRYNLLLDGTTGRVFHDSGDEENASHLLLAHSLGQFFTLLGLYWHLRCSALITSQEHTDARRSLAAWGEAIDRATIGHPHWLAIFDEHWNDPEMF